MPGGKAVGIGWEEAWPGRTPLKNLDGVDIGAGGNGAGGNWVGGVGAGAGDFLET
eukprot:CAMPEP_0205830952 /NCGR_PEP_ID=MMETSP0206-20130828/42591_1 /ASSEMBLY_ACC=CAM_ASM_000279 /TAXON_ID=36767 /ORGANISM="Euplotes focardii, Strain TN1" /LENGTH=54 /DNA_ID=CAMNT_0053135093 /DNA_START=775 /DNA_END=939 /DNA_ORIENTATION=+